MKTVLLVDDSPTFRRVLEKLLENEYRVVGHAASGEEGIDQYRALLPDLVILDIVMPNCSGKECLRQILTINPAATAVMVTSIGDEKTIEECLSLGAKAFVRKEEINYRDRQNSEFLKALAKVAAPEAL